MFVSFLAAMLQEKSLPYQPGSHTVIRKHRTAQAETVTPSEAKSSHRSAEYCTARWLTFILAFTTIQTVQEFELCELKYRLTGR